MNTKMPRKAKNPAGRNEKFEVTYTGFATNKERTEMQIDEGHEFDNEALLQMLGFEKDSNGQLVLKTNEYDCEIADNGEVIRRKEGDKVLTENVQEEVR